MSLNNRVGLEINFDEEGEHSDSNDEHPSGSLNQKEVNSDNNDGTNENQTKDNQTDDNNTIKYKDKRRLGHHKQEPIKARGGDSHSFPNQYSGGEFEDIKEKAEEIVNKGKFPWLYSPNRGVPWGFNPVELRDLAQSSVWVGIFEDAIINALKKVDWNVYKAEDESKSDMVKYFEKSPEKRDPSEIDEVIDEEVEEAVKMLADPNEEDTYYELLESVMADALEVGNMCVVKNFPSPAMDDNRILNDSSFKPDTIRPNDPAVWTKEYSEKGKLLAYWQFDKQRALAQGTTQEPVKFAVDEVAWMDINTRSNRRYGMPPTLRVIEFLDLMDLTVSQEIDYFERGMVSAGALVFDSYSQDEMDEVSKKLRETKGNPQDIPMIGGGDGSVEFEDFSQNFKELQFNERAKWYAKVIAAAFRVPVSIAGLNPEKVNYNTFQGEKENFEDNTLGSYVKLWERFVNEEVLGPHFDDDVYFELRPGMSESTKSMISDRVRKEYIKGVITKNEAREELGLDKVEDGGFLSEEDIIERSMDSDEEIGKPFGDYEDFNACVMDNQDKENPEAFCSWLEHKITGEWPSESDIKSIKKDYPDIDDYDDVYLIASLNSDSDEKVDYLMDKENIDQQTALELLSDI